MRTVVQSVRATCEASDIPKVAARVSISMSLALPLMQKLESEPAIQFHALIALVTIYEMTLTTLNI